MKRIKTPSLASINLDDVDRRITPAVINVLLMPQRLRESFSFLTKPPILFYSFIPVSTSLPGYHYLIKNIYASRRMLFIKSLNNNTD
jgi:hypothetical protein